MSLQLLPVAHTDCTDLHRSVKRNPRAALPSHALAPSHSRLPALYITCVSMRRGYKRQQRVCLINRLSERGEQVRRGSWQFTQLCFPGNDEQRYCGRGGGKHLESVTWRHSMICIHSGDCAFNAAQSLGKKLPQYFFGEKTALTDLWGRFMNYITPFLCVRWRKERREDEYEQCEMMSG